MAEISISEQEDVACVEDQTNKLSQAWLVCGVASLFFLYEFIQLNLFNAISSSLMVSLSMNASQLGQLSAFYFIANVLFLFPAGMLLDRYSIKRILLIALALCVIGTVGFAMAHSWLVAAFSRFLTGIGGGFCFLGVIRLATRWFPSKYLALVTGAVVTMAMIGGMIAQTPLMWVVSLIHWRYALLADAGLGFLIFLLMLAIVKDYPADRKSDYQQQIHDVHQLGYWRSMGHAFLRLQNWLGGIYTGLMNLPLSLLGALWGILYLRQVHHLSVWQAPNVTMMIFLGTIIGGPLVGWISDRLSMRRLPMIIGAVLSCALVLVIILGEQLTFVPLLILFFLLGLTTSTQIIGYPFVAENSIPAITAMSVSVVSITTMGSQAIFQPFFGWVMDKTLAVSHHHYVAQSFHWAMWLFPVTIVIALLAVLAMRERR